MSHLFNHEQNLLFGLSYQLDRTSISNQLNSRIEEKKINIIESIRKSSVSTSVAGRSCIIHSGGNVYFSDIGSCSN